MTDDRPRALDTREPADPSGGRSGQGVAVAGEHPSPDQLFGYHERRLPPAVADSVQEHLVACEECSRAILDFAAFPSLVPPSERHRLSPADVEERWRGLERELARWSRPLWQRHQVLLPAVALLAAMAVGLGLWGVKLRGELVGPRISGGDLEVVADLGSAETTTRGAGQGVSPSPAARRLVFVLVDPRVEGDGAYEADLVTERGRLVQTGLPVLRSWSGDFTLELSRDAVPPGAYRLELYGLEAGSRASIATYPFSIVDSGASRVAGEGREESE